MQTSELIAKIKEKLDKDALEITETPFDDILIEINKDAILSVMETLRNDPELRFDALLNHLGVDHKERFSVVYNLFSFNLDRKITVKAYLDRENPEISSIESVFAGINWFERETFEMLGITFTGHSNLQRLLLPPDWEGYPLRKDYAFPDQYHGVDNRERSNFK